MEFVSRLKNWDKKLANVDWVLVIAILFFSTMLGTLSVQRYVAYNARMLDLGNMAQSIWSATRGRPLEFTYGGVNISRLSLHVELFYFLLVPLYALFPSPITLVLFQAFLFGIGALPLYRLALRRSQSKNLARALVFIYLLYPTAQSAVLFDFHGDTLAMPLLLFALEALERKTWRMYGLWLAAALSCKFYVALPVCLLGVYLYFQGGRRVGVLTFLSGFIWGGFAFFVIRPAFTSVNVAPGQLSVGGYVAFYFGSFLSDIVTTWQNRLVHAIIVFAPLVPVLLYADRWALIAAAIAFPVVISSGPGPAYDFRTHHYAVVVPFIMLSILSALTKLKTRTMEFRLPILKAKSVPFWRVMTALVVGLTLFMNMQLVSTPLQPGFWSTGSDGGLASWRYGRTARDQLKDRWLARHVSSDAALLASTLLAPHLANRHTLHVTQHTDGTGGANWPLILQDIDFAVLDGLLDYVELSSAGVYVGDVAYERIPLTKLTRDPAFGLIAAQDGLLLFQRRPKDITDEMWDDMALAQRVTIESADDAPDPLALFGDVVALLEYSSTQIRDRRFLLRYAWLAKEEVVDSGPLFAISVLQGVENARILHLPTYIIHPTTVWEPGTVVIEEFTVEFPAEIVPGTYNLTVSWYAAENVDAYATDARSRVGDVVPVGQLSVK